MKKYILTIDQGTTSTRSILFDKKANIVSISQMEIEQICPNDGWVEHNPLEIWNSTIFGRKLSEVVNDGIKAKLYLLNDTTQYKFRQSLEKVVNKNKTINNTTNNYNKTVNKGGGKGKKGAAE